MCVIIIIRMTLFTNYASPRSFLQVIPILAKQLVAEETTPRNREEEEIIGYCSNI